MQFLDVSYNLFEGELPASLGKAARFTDLYAGNNGFSGSIPAEIGNIPGLFTFECSECALEGDLLPCLLLHVVWA